MHSARRFGFAAIVLLLLAMVSTAAEYRFDDDEPDVKDRVARISFVKGDVRIKRSDNDEWEKAVLNLPIVEGDELTAGPDSRFEIQLGAYSHIRVDERSNLKVSSLKDNLVAVSLTEGNLTATLVRFDPDNESFEIDAPQTTVALLKSGRYRVDAGPQGYEAVRVSIPEDGEARVYSNNSGFTLHAGRSARIFVTGRYVGEFEHSDAAQYVDTFDRWAVDRDELIAKRQAQAYYGKYYDTDIYGADDLNDNGDWLYTQDYGYVWRPYRSSLSGYADWSPYRYGSWRWVPAYGWAWVNDEPWGWATYHHGRWIWYNGGWYWTPYGYQQHRSWWYPALVVLTVFDRNVCWYPLPYRYAYYNYNRHYRGRRNNDDGGRTGGNTVTQPVTRRGPVEPQRNIIVTPPASSVVAISVDEFGKGRGGFVRFPRELAHNVIAQVPSAQDDGPRLPVMRDIGAKVSDDIRAGRPQEPGRAVTVIVGAAKRNDDQPLDKNLRNRIIFGNRPVVSPKTSIDDGNVNVPGDRRNAPPIGAVGRPAAKSADQPASEPRRVIIPAPNREPSKSVKRDDPPPQRKEPVRRDTPVYEPQRKSEPPPQKPEPSREPTRREVPIRRSDPPPRKTDAPKTEPGKQPDAPVKKP